MRRDSSRKRFSFTVLSFTNLIHTLTAFLCVAMLSYEMRCYVDGKAMLRKGETGDWVGTFSGHTGAIWTCDIDSGATRLVTASADYTR